MLVAAVWTCRSIGKIKSKRNDVDEPVFLVGGVYESSVRRQPSLAW